MEKRHGSTWMTRQTNNQKSLTASKRQYIKGELMNYHYYKNCWEMLERKRIELNQRYQDRLDAGCSKGSIIKMPDGSTTASPWQIERTAEVYDVIASLRLYAYNLDIIDSWLAILTPEQYRSIMAYVIDRQCSDPEGAAKVVGCSPEAVRKAAERAIDRIVAKNL